ncbi:MAG: hypothetical protein Q9176_002872 [Flavoplaca citrina]
MKTDVKPVFIANTKKRKLCARHDNRTEVQAKDVKVLRDMNAAFHRMHDRINEVVGKVENEEAAKTRKD